MSDIQYNTRLVCLLLGEFVSQTESVLCTLTKHFLHMCYRSIMSDIQRDNRVVSLSSRAGIRNSLVTILDQLQRCQKSLNEFLEVHTQMCIFVCKDYISKTWIFKQHNFLCVWSFAGEALCLPTVLLHRRWWSVRDSRSGDQPNCHPVTPQETLCRSETCFVLFSCPVLCCAILSFALFSSLYPLFHSIFCWTENVSGVLIISAGIHSVVFDEQCQHIVAMCSLEGETVPLRNLIRISSLVEVKLL